MSLTLLGAGSSTGVSNPLLPSNTVAPAVTGTPTSGQTLTTTNGTWTNSPTSYAYQWVSNGSSIVGATSSTYALTDSEVGATVSCRVTATNAAGSRNATSNSVGPITAIAPTNTVLPAVSGTAQEGQTLTSTTGTWTHSPTSYSYQWYDGTTGAVAGATSSTFVLTSGQVGHTVYCAVVATNSGGSSSAVASSAVGPVTAGSFSPSMDFSDGRNSDYIPLISF